jgi:hypothetical protein
MGDFYKAKGDNTVAAKFYNKALSIKNNSETQKKTERS